MNKDELNDKYNSFMDKYATKLDGVLFMWAESSGEAVGIVSSNPNLVRKARADWREYAQEFYIKEFETTECIDLSIDEKEMFKLWLNVEEVEG